MMLAMMLPSVIPMLQRHREAIVRARETRLGRLTAMVGVGYFAVWTVLGVVVFPLGVVLAFLEMRSPLLSQAIPAASGVVVIIGGALQFTPWKARHLALCREAAPRGCGPAAHSRSALRYGLRLGLHCCYCCVGLTAMLLAIGVMDSRAMVLVAGAITAERLAASGQRVARAIGLVALGVGVFLVARAITLA